MNSIDRLAPIYLLAGRPGSRRPEDPLLQRVLAGCGVAEPSVAYVGAASGDSKPFFLTLAASLRKSGAGRVDLVALVGRRARLERARTSLEQADIIFMGGGDVEAGMQVLERHCLLPLFRELYEAGKPFFGISAGSIMLGQQWVRWSDAEDDSTAEPFPCLGLAPLICDTHGEGENWQELRTLLCLGHEGALGYGIPSGAGLCVYPNGSLEALGTAVHCFVKKRGRVVRGEELSTIR